MKVSIAVMAQRVATLFACLAHSMLLVLCYTCPHQGSQWTVISPTASAMARMQVLTLRSNRRQSEVRPKAHSLRSARLNGWPVGRFEGSWQANGGTGDRQESTVATSVRPSTARQCLERCTITTVVAHWKALCALHAKATATWPINQTAEAICSTRSFLLSLSLCKESAPVGQAAWIWVRGMQRMHSATPYLKTAHRTAALQRSPLVLFMKKAVNPIKARMPEKSHFD